MKRSRGAARGPWVIVLVAGAMMVSGCRPYHIARSEMERLAAEAEARLMAELELERQEEAARQEEVARQAEAIRQAEARRVATEAVARREAEQRRQEARRQEEARQEEARREEEVRRQEAARRAETGADASGAASTAPAGQARAPGAATSTAGAWSQLLFVQGDKPIQYQTQVVETLPDGSLSVLIRFHVNKQDQINNCGPIADCLGYYLALRYDFDVSAGRYRQTGFYWFDKGSDASLTLGPVTVPMLSDAQASAVYDPQQGFMIRWANGTMERRGIFMGCADHKLASSAYHRCSYEAGKLPAQLVR